MILIPILGIFLFFQQTLMEKQEEAFPLLPNTLQEGRMSAINLTGDALAAHAAACIAAEAELVRLRNEEQHRSRAINPVHGPRNWLKTVLMSANDAFTGTLKLPRHAWRSDDVKQTVLTLSGEAAKIAWNGNAPQAEEPSQPILWMQPSIDGLVMLVRFNPERLHSIIPAQFLGLLIWYASKLVLEETIARAYDLTATQVQCLVTGNRRLRPLFCVIVTAISKHNYGVWWREYEHERPVPRICERLHELLPGTISSYGVSLPEAFVDLPVYSPTGKHAGERIDPLCMLGQKDQCMYTHVVNQLGDLRAASALEALYRQSELSPEALSALSPLL